MNKCKMHNINVQGFLDCIEFMLLPKSRNQIIKDQSDQSCFMEFLNSKDRILN